MTIRHSRLLVVSLAASLMAPRVSAQSSDTLSVEQRMLTATRIYAGLQAFFAHWDGAPGLDVDRDYAAYVRDIARTSDRRAFDLASMAFVAKFNNGHTWFGDWWLRRRDGQALGFYAHPIDGHWTVTEATAGPLAVGDVIERIDSLPIDEFYRRNRQYLFASDERWRARTLFEHPYLFPARFLVGLEGGRTVSVERAGPFVFHGDAWQADSVRLTSDSILVIRIPSFGKTGFEDSALAALRVPRTLRAIVLDLRGNHGGTVPNRLVRALMDRPYRNWTQSTPSSVAMFRSWGVLGSHAQIEWASELAGAPKAGSAAPLFILVDGGCYSACEDAVMPFLENHRATVIGEQTAGSSSQTNIVDLGDGMAVGIGMVRYRLPGGQPFEGVGLTPDVVVHRTAADLRSGRDPALAATLARASAREQ